MIVDWQYEPIKGHLLHIDLKRIAMDKALRVNVPIVLHGVPLGVKTEGGILQIDFPAKVVGLSVCRAISLGTLILMLAS